MEGVFTGSISLCRKYIFVEVVHSKSDALYQIDTVNLEIITTAPLLAWVITRVQAPLRKIKETTTTIHSHRFVMALLQRHNVYKLGEDELPDPWWP